MLHSLVFTLLVAFLVPQQALSQCLEYNEASHRGVVTQLPTASNYNQCESDCRARKLSHVCLYRYGDQRCYCADDTFVRSTSGSDCNGLAAGAIAGIAAGILAVGGAIGFFLGRRRQGGKKSQDLVSNMKGKGPTELAPGSFGIIGARDVVRTEQVNVNTNEIGHTSPSRTPTPATLQTSSGHSGDSKDVTLLLIPDSNPEAPESISTETDDIDPERLLVSEKDVNADREKLLLISPMDPGPSASSNFVEKKENGGYQVFPASEKEDAAVAHVVEVEPSESNHGSSQVNGQSSGSQVLPGPAVYDMDEAPPAYAE
ncbi:hypothetical protein HDV05_006601 [Chytridiales sp. JEL 0842]|nr:hypothetical protein HDV05_006601 [Chytridiales sp. JEL 0842]